MKTSDLTPQGTSLGEKEANLKVLAEGTLLITVPLGKQSATNCCFSPGKVRGDIIGPK